jgi:hypothetical protein
MVYTTYRPARSPDERHCSENPSLSGSYRPRRNLLGYCLVRAVEGSTRLDLRHRARCPSRRGFEISQVPHSGYTGFKSYLWTQAAPHVPGAIIGLLFLCERVGNRATMWSESWIMGDYDDDTEKNKRLRGDEKTAASLRWLTNSWRDFLSPPINHIL